MVNQGASLGWLSSVNLLVVLLADPGHGTSLTWSRIISSLVRTAQSRMHKSRGTFSLCVNKDHTSLFHEASTTPSKSSVLALVCLCWFGVVRGLFTNTKKVISDTHSLAVLPNTHF